MSGEDLYNLYVEAMEKQGAGVDVWDALNPVDQAVWDDVADQVVPAGRAS